MDIYSFINSKDIAEHCRTIGHEFTPLEMAAIVCTSSFNSVNIDKTLEKRHKAYTWIIENTPDCEMPERDGVKYYHSLHDVLRTIMSAENKLGELFETQEEGTYYELNVTVEWPWVFNSWKNAFENALENKSLLSFSIIKRPFEENPHESKRIARFHNKSGEITQLRERGYLTEEDADMVHNALWCMDIDFPMPFKSGDI